MTPKTVWKCLNTKIFVSQNQFELTCVKHSWKSLHVAAIWVITPKLFDNAWIQEKFVTQNNLHPNMCLWKCEWPKQWKILFSKIPPILQCHFQKQSWADNQDLWHTFSLLDTMSLVLACHNPQTGPWTIVHSGSGVFWHGRICLSSLLMYLEGLADMSCNAHWKCRNMAKFYNFYYLGKTLSSWNFKVHLKVILTGSVSLLLLFLFLVLLKDSIVSFLQNSLLLFCAYSGKFGIK